MRALTQDAPEAFKSSVKEVPVPQLGENEILVKVEYYAQNPTDWKHTAFLSPKGATSGCDFSGTVAVIPEGVANPASLKVGDKVAGVVHGGMFPNGAAAEYTKVQSDLLWKVPEGQKMDEAATFGIGWLTALHALLLSQGKSFPPAQDGRGRWFLLYGASSSVGLFAVQLAKAMGYKVIAVCSPHSFDLVKSYGADDVVDYHDATKASEEIKRISGGGVEIGLDTISEGDSFKIAVGGFGEKGGRLNAILPASEEAKAIRKDVEIESTLMYTFFGKEFNFRPRPGMDDMIFPAKPEDRAFFVDACKRTPDLITSHNLKANPVDNKGGLDDVLDGYQDMKNKKVSGKKLVYKISQ